MFEKRGKGEVSSKLCFKTGPAFCIHVVGKMRKYIFLAFVMLFLKEITTFESEERDDSRSFRQCKPCICDQVSNKETYDRSTFNGRCDFSCASDCANPELRLNKMDRSEGHRSRWGQKHDAISGNFPRTPVLWNSILLPLIIAICTYK